MNAAVIAEMTGPAPSFDSLTQALAALQNRHPLLRAGFQTGSGTGPSFAVAPGPLRPIPLRIAPGGASWIEETEREIQTPLPDAGPLIRCVLCPSGDPSTRTALVLAFHHAIGDGRSGVVMVRDLLEAIATDRAAASLPPSPDVQARIAQESSGLQTAWSFLRLAAPAVWMKTRYGPPLQLRLTRQCPPRDRVARISQRVLEVDETHRLTEKARANQTTVHGALAAAILGAISATAPDTNGGTLGLGSAVDIRPHVDASLAEVIGFFAAMSSYQAPLDRKRPFWDTARAVRRSLAADVESGRAVRNLALTPVMYRMVGGDAAAPDEFVDRFEKAAPQTAGLTNLGRLDLPLNYGPLQLESVHFAVNVASSGVPVVVAVSLRGRLTLNFMWHEPRMDRTAIGLLLDDIVRRLREASN